MGEARQNEALVNPYLFRNLAKFAHAIESNEAEIIKLHPDVSQDVVYVAGLNYCLPFTIQVACK